MSGRYVFQTRKIIRRQEEVWRKLIRRWAVACWKWIWRLQEFGKKLFDVQRVKFVWPVKRLVVHFFSSIEVSMEDLIWSIKFKLTVVPHLVFQIYIGWCFMLQRDVFWTCWTVSKNCQMCRVVEVGWMQNDVYFVKMYWLFGWYLAVFSTNQNCRGTKREIVCWYWNGVTRFVRWLAL